MNTSSTPKNSAPATTTKPASSFKPLTLKPPKLLFPTLATSLSAALLLFFTFNTPHTNSTSLNTLIDMFQFTLIPLVPAFGLFLLHRLLEVIILHHAFRPIHLLSTVTILFSASVYFPVIGLLIINIVLYILAMAIFAASLSFQKSHSLTTDSAHFRSSLLSTAVATAILGLINLLILTLQILPLDIPYQISGPLFNILISVSVVAIFPLQLTLTFLTLTKLTSARRANLLSRSNLLTIFLSLLLTATISITYLAYFKHIITEDYSRRQPCCHQPTYYED